MSSLSLAEELVLLSYDDSGAALVASPDLDYAVAGAVLCDLTMAGKLDLDSSGRVVLASNEAGRPSDGVRGAPYLDRLLAVVAAGPPKPPQQWVVELSHDVVGQVLDALADSGLLRRAPGRILWILDRTRYLPPDGVGRAAEQAAEADARSRLAAARSGGSVDARTSALAGLLHALGADHPAGPAAADADAVNPDTDAVNPAEGDALSSTDGDALSSTDGDAVEQPFQWPLRATAKAISDHRTAVASGVFIATNVAAGGS